MTASVDERTAIVTGGGSGIGLAIAVRLAEDGLAVAIFDRNGEAATAAAERIASTGRGAAGFEVDVTDRGQIDRGVAEVRERLGRPTVLVNSAGLDGFDPFLSITAEKWQRILAVNLTGTFDCCQAVVPDMIEAGWGRIVNISSSSAHSGQPLMTHYVAAKAGVIGFTKALALDSVQGNHGEHHPPGVHRHPDAQGIGEARPPRARRRAPRGPHPGRPGRTAGGHRRRLLLPRP